jgi:tetratricopeptide (TPR) repeat protein
MYRAAHELLAGKEEGALRDLDALALLPPEDYARYREFDIPSPSSYPALAGAAERLVRRTRHPFALLLRAFVRRASLRYDDALSDTRLACARAPRNAGLRAILARLRFIGRVPEASLADLDAATRLAPKCGWIRAWRAEGLRHRGRLSHALAESDTAVRLAPGYRRAYGWRGAILRQLGHPRRALADFDRALAGDWEYWWGVQPDGREADTSLSWLAHERFLALRALGRTADAVAALNDAHRLNTRYGWVWPAAGEGSFAEGEAELTRLLSRRPRHAWARAWRGWTRLSDGRPARALEDLRAAVRALPGRAEPVLWLARVLAESGDIAGALATSRRAVRIDPHYAPARAWLGGYLRARQCPGAALRELNRAVALDPVLAWAWAWAGECHLRLGRPRRAEEPLRRALVLDSSNADAWVWSAEAALALGRRPEAARRARRALALDASRPRALSVLAAATRRPSDARRALQALPHAMMIQKTPHE